MGGAALAAEAHRRVKSFAFCSRPLDRIRQFIPTSLTGRCGESASGGESGMLSDEVSPL
jgi:hypothetical protein